MITSRVPPKKNTPRARETKSKAKPMASTKTKRQLANLANTSKTSKRRGRSQDSDINSDSDDEGPVAKKARKRKGVDSEVEVIEEDVEPAEKEVEIISDVSYKYTSMNETLTLVKG